MSQNVHRTRSAIFGLVIGLGVAAFAGVLMGQGASQPVRSEPQYFVTADGEGAHLWVREGTVLRVISHGACKECAGEDAHEHGHEEGEGHDHGTPAPKK